MSAPVILDVQDLRVQFTRRTGPLWAPGGIALRAVNGVSFALRQGEILGVAGESGCGKSTLIRAILRVVEPCGGRVMFDHDDVTAARRRQLRGLRRGMQLVFQDPYASLDGRMRIIDIIAEPRINFGLDRGPAARERAAELMRQAGLSQALARRFPHQLSGGQRQRVGIARALAAEPRILFCDEPVSALDVSIQAQIINLLRDLRQRLDLSVVFISHDLSVVRHISDRVAVMYLGRFVEVAPAATLYADPRHPYTRALLAAVPIPDPVAERARIQQPLRGELPSPEAERCGCDFASRCPRVMERCRRCRPSDTDLGDGHRAACFLAADAEAGT